MPIVLDEQVLYLLFMDTRSCHPAHGAPSLRPPTAPEGTYATGSKAVSATWMQNQRSASKNCGLNALRLPAGSKAVSNNSAIPAPSSGRCPIKLRLLLKAAFFVGPVFSPFYV